MSTPRPAPYRWIIPGFAGFALGVLATAAWNLSAPPSPPAAVDQTATIQSLEQERSMLRKQLRTALSTSGPPLAPTSPPTQSDPPAKAEIPSVSLTALRPTSSGKTMREQLSERLDVMALRLHLTSSQKAYATQRFEDVVDSFGASGGSTWQDFEAEIANQLTPEQKAEYDVFRQEQLNSRIEMAATSELHRLQRAVGLSEEQKENVFNKLAEIQAYLIDTPSGERRTLRPDEMRAIRRKALSQILSSEQMQLYDRQAQSSGRVSAGTP